MSARAATSRVSKEDYVALASFRYELRRFLHFSSTAAQAAGLSPQQHQALLVIKGTPERDHLSIGELAERLQLKHHSAVGLIDRLTKRRLVKRVASAEDKRKVNIHLTEQGEELIRGLSATHRDELRVIAPELRKHLEALARR